MKCTASLVLAILMACVAHTVGASPAARTTSRDNRSAQLGEVNFQTSCSAEVRQTMNQAVALLHSFQYQQAESAFAEVARRDPRCAMAEWGKAMSLYHQIWDFPDAATLAKGRADVEQARKLGAKTQTERDYISAAAVFYREAPGLSHEARVAAYVKAMETAYKDSPRDPNVAAFYGLALVSLGNLKKAIAILQPMFKLHPNNPGLAHYLIHATDTPELAPEGLAAARRYAQIAPDSSHALHMPSHIFTRLGLWQESIQSNLASASAAAKATEAHEADSSYQVHAMDFLDYAYLQGGQEAKARQIIVELKNVPGANPDDILDMQSSLAARNAVELHSWKKAAALVVPKLPIWRLDTTYFSRTLGAARSGDAAAARADLSKLSEAVAGQRKHFGGQFNFSQGPSTEEREARAWVDFAEAKTGEALNALRAAADQEDAAGVDSLAMPAREMLGDMLLAEKQPKNALAAYRVALKESPNRFDGLWGAAEAAEAIGDATAARGYYSKLIAICPPGADRPELKQARADLSAK